MEHKELVTKALQLLPSLLALEVSRITQEVESGVGVESVDQVLGSDHDSMRRVSEACVTYVSLIEDEAKRQSKKAAHTTDSLASMLRTSAPNGATARSIHEEIERRLRDIPVGLNEVHGTSSGVGGTNFFTTAVDPRSIVRAESFFAGNTPTLSFDPAAPVSLATGMGLSDVGPATATIQEADSDQV